MMSKKGFTLIEVIVAILVAAIAVVAIFAVILSAFRSAPKSDQKETAGLTIRQAAERLKAYVADQNAWTQEFPSSLPRNLCSDTPTNDDGNRAPFASGEHNVSCLLAGTVLEGGTLTYRVTDVNAGGQLQYRKVDFSLELPE
jgi:prepilin-type N-terminal cleavage/methylation domain-containing protein